MTNPFALDTPVAPAQPAAVATLPPPAAITGVFVAPSTTPTAMQGGEDPFGAPAPQLPRGPRVRDMYGRLLLITPRLVERVPNTAEGAAPGAMVDRMTADVVILDGPCPYGGSPEKVPPVPHTKMADVPHRSAGMYISSVGLVSQCREALAKRAANQPGMVLGRLSVGVAKGPTLNPPYLLTPATEADKVLARQFLASVDPFA
jgi:hypothetical protein